MGAAHAALRLAVLWGGLAIGGAALAACPQAAEQTARHMVDLFAAHRLSTMAAKGLLGPDGSAVQHGAYWEVRADACFAGIVLRARAEDESSDDAELRLRPEAGLVLGDLVKYLGPWQVVSSSKTSSVAFRGAGAAGSSMTVYALLFTPQPSPRSPVLLLQLRRDGSASPAAQDRR
ncbi:hypothetical protein [Aquabacterium sp.]|uniref:hypothetical protein n=1 Tax=Aquabacterium sp. TaxID=1872578 RepID=UPI002C8D96FF|nr:hypothetical protein [Aquabacterium sp.]HSW04443.1 hypothetical protein [Aquabacterium sp.]